LKKYDVIVVGVGSASDGSVIGMMHIASIATTARRAKVFFIGYRIYSLIDKL
jgi:hypothetical protein